jgi:hypothetical protein
MIYQSLRGFCMRRSASVRRLAAIGFDDDFLYREIPRPPVERSVPAHRLLADEARVTFETWRHKADKMQY